MGEKQILELLKPYYFYKRPIHGAYHVKKIKVFSIKFAQEVNSLYTRGVSFTFINK